MCFGVVLTIFTVVSDLHLPFLRAKQCLGHLGDGVAFGELAMQEVAGAGFLHDVWSRVARHLAEAVIAVDDGTVGHPGICYDEFLV